MSEVIFSGSAKGSDIAKRMLFARQGTPPVRVPDDRAPFPVDYEDRVVWCQIRWVAEPTIAAAEGLPTLTCPGKFEFVTVTREERDKWERENA